MFGIDSTILAFIVLAGFSAGAVAYAFMFNTIETEKNAGKRLETVKPRLPSGAKTSRIR